MIDVQIKRCKRQIEKRQMDLKPTSEKHQMLQPDPDVPLRRLVVEMFRESGLPAIGAISLPMATPPRAEKAGTAARAFVLFCFKSCGTVEHGRGKERGNEQDCTHAMPDQ